MHVENVTRETDCRRFENRFCNLSYKSLNILERPTNHNYERSAKPPKTSTLFRSALLLELPTDVGSSAFSFRRSTLFIASRSGYTRFNRTLVIRNPKLN